MVSLAPSPAPNAADTPGSHSASDSAFRLPTSDFLAAADSHLLLTLLRLNLDLDAAATATSTPLDQLLDFLVRPDITQRIETYQRFRLASANDKLLTHTAESRIKAIHTLEKLSETTENPIEKRRHAHLILRYSTPISYASPAPRPRASAQHPSAPAPNLPFDITTAPQPPERTTRRQLTEHLAKVLVAYRRPGAPEDPHARTRTLAALHACFARGGTLNGKPIPLNPLEFMATLDPATEGHLIAEMVQVFDAPEKPDGPSPTFTLDLIRAHQPPAQAHLTLTHTSEFAPWRIAAMTTSANTS